MKHTSSSGEFGTGGRAEATMARRHYSDADRAAALAVYDSTADQVHRLRDAARQFGCPVSTLRRWLADRENAAPADLRTQEKETLADVYDRVAFRAASLQDRVMGWLEDQPADVVAKYLPDLNRTGGTATDKAQLLRGNPTGIHEVRDWRRKAEEEGLDLDEVFAEAERILASADDGA